MTIPPISSIKIGKVAANSAQRLPFFSAHQKPGSLHRSLARRTQSIGGSLESSHNLLAERNHDRYDHDSNHHPDDDTVLRKASGPALLC